MENTISPRYLTHLVEDITQKLFNEFPNSKYYNVEQYIKKWQKTTLDDNWNITYDFDIKYNKDNNIDIKTTLHNINETKLLKIAIDLGLETPDFIPSIPTFKNKLKETSRTARQIFDDAYKTSFENPSKAFDYCNSALESILKEILQDSLVKEELQAMQEKQKDANTMRTLVSQVIKVFKKKGDLSADFSALCNHIENICNDIENIRSRYGQAHGRTDSDLQIEEPLYAYLMINSTATVGLFLLNYYEKLFHKTDSLDTSLEDDELPF